VDLASRIHKLVFVLALAGVVVRIDDIQEVVRALLGTVALVAVFFANVRTTSGEVNGKPLEMDPWRLRIALPWPRVLAVRSRAVVRSQTWVDPFSWPVSTNRLARAPTRLAVIPHSCTVAHVMLLPSTDSIRHTL
jgi:hypothetical protein